MNFKVFDWYSHTNKIKFYFLEARWEEIQPREGSLETKKKEQKAHVMTCCLPK